MLLAILLISCANQKEQYLEGEFSNVENGYPIFKFVKDGNKRFYMAKISNDSIWSPADTLVQVSKEEINKMFDESLKAEIQEAWSFEKNAPKSSLTRVNLKTYFFKFNKYEKSKIRETGYYMISSTGPFHKKQVLYKVSD